MRKLVLLVSLTLFSVSLLCAQDQDLIARGYKEFEVTNNDPMGCLAKILFGELSLSAVYDVGVQRGNLYYFYRFYQFPWVRQNEVVVVEKTETSAKRWYYKINSLKEPGKETRKLNAEKLGLMGIEVTLWD